MQGTLVFRNGALLAVRLADGNGAWPLTYVHKQLRKEGVALIHEDVTFILREARGEVGVYDEAGTRITDARSMEDRPLCSDPRHEHLRESR